MWSKFGRAEAPDFNGYQTWVYYSSFCRLDEFLPGVAIAMIKHFHRGWWAQLMRRGRLSFAVGLACTVAICYLLNVYLYVDGAGVSFALTALGYPALAISFAILTLSALSPDSPLYKLRVPGAAKLALWSYAIYLTHKPLAFILHGQLEALGFAADSWAAAAIIAVCALVVGAGLYLLIERPFMRLRDRVFPTNFPGAIAQSIGVAA